MRDKTGNNVMPLVQLDKAWILPTITQANSAHHVAMEGVLLHNRLGRPGSERLEQAVRHQGRILCINAGEDWREKQALKGLMEAITRVS